jgi:hypothetical protein
MARMIRTAASAIFAVMAATLAAHTASAQKPETTSAFDAYISKAETQIRQEQASPDSFLAFQPGSASATEIEARLRHGEVLIDNRANATESSGSPIEVPGGLIHRRRGLTFIPNATIADLFAVLQDYDRSARYYAPEVITSRLISRNEDDFKVAMRLREHRIVTVVLDTEYDIHYGQLDAAHQYSISRSTRIAEIADPGEPDERPLPAGHDHGFLWRLNAYWRFVQAPDGVFLQCEAISLTRDVPTGLNWLIGPYIKNIPRESLQFTLTATRNAVLTNKNLNQPSHSTPTKIP